VRQGPFAGVHVVVSSQTLSSMPAMDRSTLSLLPMRIAFMCNESDADLVMGDANREVKALSQQGEGIFNPARGDPSHNKPFRGLYIPPDARNALLQAIEEKASVVGPHHRPRVFDGDILAERPEERASGSPTRPVFAVGEPLTLEPWAGVTLRRGRSANLLLLGNSDNDGPAWDSSIDGAAQSCLTDAARQGLSVQVVDFIGDGDPGKDALDLMELCDMLALDYRRGSMLADVLADVSGVVETRRQSGEYKADGYLLLLNGLERALDLAPEDTYAESEGSSSPDPATLLADILRDGPEVGCHTAIVVDNLAQFDRRLGREMLKEFDFRIAGSALSRTPKAKSDRVS
jgi:S-DNA-T family DNA segregation ATPase FtsK/SpoIIIE